VPPRRQAPVPATNLRLPLGRSRFSTDSLRRLAGILVVMASGGAGAAEPDSLAEAVAAGTFAANVRLRYEAVEQGGLREAGALTLGTRLGGSSAPYRGLKFQVEAENITAADGDAYSQVGLNPGGAGRAIVADPEATELNQALVTFVRGQSAVMLGRQRLVLDNARFVGDVGWRQNMQTFDGLVLQNKSLTQTALTYAYLNRVHRVFSRRHAQGRWRSDSHLFNASSMGSPAGTFTAYAYLLDFPDAASRANSSATYGASWAGTSALARGPKLTWRCEAATQSDFGSGKVDYTATYTALQMGLGFKAVGFNVGHELLGSRGQVGFQTPLATLHAFNGWADLFLAPPAAGLRDARLTATATLPGSLALVVTGHRFRSDRGRVDFGREFDLQVSRTFARNVTALAKFAAFRSDVPHLPDVRKIWVQLEFVH